MPRLYSGSPWQQFRQKWQDCPLCPLCETRKNIVLCRGAIPCDVGFCGEAPGQSENVIGHPFIGPAGKLLDQQIEEAMERADKELRLVFFNLVCCIPLVDGRKVGEPSKESIQACEPRLDEFIELCKPRLIIAVGDLAKKYLGDKSEVSIVHPAAILRAEVVRQALMHQRAIVIMENAFKDL